MADQTVYVQTMGCDKNTVDSENMVGGLLQQGYTLTDEPSEASLIIVNTCCFIEAAKKQSIEVIFDLLPYRTQPEENCQTFVVAGCMAQRYAEELKAELPEVDYFIGVNQIDDLPDIIQNQADAKIYTSAEIRTESEKRYVRKGQITEYLKISEGCDNHCTYCAIPNIRGRHRSRSPEVIIKEAQTLYDSGVRELILVAQNLTQYGSDLDGDMDLADLLDELAGRIPFTWIRLLYMYPEGIDAKLLDVINAHDNICHYFDMPIQHTEDEVLHRMGRRIDKKEIYGKVNLIREKCPDAVLRTTVIAGFPGESEAQFNAMLETLNDLKFERLGAFAYSQEEGTPVAEMPDQIDDAVKEERVRQIYERQEAISTNWNTRWIDQEMTVLIDEIDENGIAIGRTRGDAPEIDGDVIIETSQPEPGHFYRVKIVDAIGFDLIGEVINESTK
ncbi:30S ribosomal protein S12 methylthiotransferase RimO [Pseudoramibacter porci]|uniref:Ribosomal protein uS12 methylthiotransferase RimO n=1 Tax=Pseudoramibacter porci TaxID=2606631 RepID=A0A7X2NFM7_9FIRM|nr:30S ribosomal protein S12 methylthiotransferase RimO [Pseudoramibacter porci]MSS19551.1 30S ribosomal protein S12 methylthiotransferase RimO [Pseudoramibacter porci]